ncbi:hypothetical protein AXF42_Ash004916 [Apostasia shenzhenica]|uniref:G-patch domain-containing protein n=1 Tax=Apostasia shenzhenica TaxID=1088818 RepID=A0A2I0B7Y4_9ASPA|nr:hypothetical protein AXF42_Ash004916 [Apostasia shenzhenica]
MDGLFYTFENGNYVPLESGKEDKFVVDPCISYSNGSTKVESCVQQHCPSEGTKSDQPPSEWLEDTLIDLYLSGYANAAVHPDSEHGGEIPYVELNDHFSSDDLPNWQRSTENEEQTTDLRSMDESNDGVSSKCFSLEEENWQAQYGQVTQVADEDFPPFSIIDLWDWEMIRETKRKCDVMRLIGRLVRRSSTLHPSVPAGGSLFKTAAIRDVHLDLVRVASGKVYRLRSPSVKYLASLSKYDSSNPTKDWNFPDFFASDYDHKAVAHDQARNFDAVINSSSSIYLIESPCLAEKKRNSVYRDRAAERRALHGGFGTGPGQKNFFDNNVAGAARTPESGQIVDEANSSFGPGSYARKILESMGWKHGEALGRSNKGILEPLNPAGNKGYAGLGWNHSHFSL